jgi:hypothetical protein
MMEETRAGRILNPLSSKTFAGKNVDTPKHPTVETALPQEIISLEDSLLQQTQEVDEQLRHLIKSWPQLPTDIRDTIATLIDVSSDS